MNSNSDFGPRVTEPHLKYNRVHNNATEIVAKDSISCIDVHSKFLAIGTEWGNIYILDHIGNQTFKTHINAHSTVINQISIDSRGEYIASCSNDGKVMIFSLLDDNQYPSFNFNREIKAIAISPDFKRTSQFVTGDTRILLLSKGLLTPHKIKLLEEYKSIIRNIKWRTNFIIYATDDSVYILDMREEKVIGIIDPDKSHLSTNREDFYCRISWINNKSFVIGWGNLIQICVIKDNPNYSLQIKQLELTGISKSHIHKKKVESTHSFLLPDLILGIVPYEKRLMVLLHQQSSPDSNLSEDLRKSSTLIEIIEPSDSDPQGYVDISYEQIKLKDYETSKRHKLHLAKIPLENEFYIVSPKDLICAKEREIDDRIKWLIENQQFEKALNLTQTPNLNTQIYTYKHVGMLYIDHLLLKNQYTEAAEISKSILNDKETWEIVIKKFLENNCVEILLPSLPYTDDLKLSQETYMSILQNQHNKDLLSFLKLLKTWPPTLFKPTQVMDIIFQNRNNKQLLQRKPADKLSEDMQRKEKILLESLAILYEQNQQYERSLQIYIRLKRDYVFQLIIQRKLFDFVNKNLMMLFNYNREKTLNILMDFINEFPPETIVKSLSNVPLCLCHYLHTLFTKNIPASERYHNDMVPLYAEFKSEFLLSFLKTSDKYDLNIAIELCKKKKLTEEVIYLLGRIGKSKEALEMIMSQEDSVFKAIDYCCERGDEELWGQLLNFASNQPKFIKAILESTSVDIRMDKFIRQILNGIDIPGIRDSLVILLINNEKRNNIINAHQVGKWNDIFHMIETRFNWSKKSIICNFADKTSCVSCERSIINCQQGFILFPCSHFCHEICLNENKNVSQKNCPLCSDS